MAFLTKTPKGIFVRSGCLSLGGHTLDCQVWASVTKVPDWHLFTLGVAHALSFRETSSTTSVQSQVTDAFNPQKAVAMMDAPTTDIELDGQTVGPHSLCLLSRNCIGRQLERKLSLWGVVLHAVPAAWLVNLFRFHGEGFLWIKRASRRIKGFRVLLVLRGMSVV